MSDKVFNHIANKISDLLDEGTAPWQKPWNMVSRPVNGQNGHIYKGYNSIFLNFVTLAKYSENIFFGYSQAKKLGGNVKEGESHWPILIPHVKYYDKEEGKKISRKKGEQLEEEDPERVNKWITYSYAKVFNIAQCEGIDRSKLHKNAQADRIEFQEIQEAQELWNRWTTRPALTHKGNKAYYITSTDKIVMPPQNSFVSSEEYYRVLFHESVHATGHKDRVYRPEVGEKKTKEQKSKEEMIAEIGGAFLCGIAGIEQKTIENQASYIKGYKERIKNDTRLFVKALREAEKSVRYILKNSEKIERKKVA